MSSLFSFLRTSDAAAENPDMAAPVSTNELFTADTAASLPAAAPALAETAVPPIQHGAPSQSEVLLKMHTALAAFLPDPAPPLPAANVSFVNVAEKPTGLGNFIGQERLSHFPFALKGGRLEADVRFQLWGATPAAVDLEIDALHGRLLEAKAALLTPDESSNLPASRFLRITPGQSPAADHVPSLNAWRRTAEYNMLYEYVYVDADGAQSLIARIPIHTDPEELNSPERETAVVTDAMVRWDEESAPILELRGRQKVRSLSALLFVPGAAPTGAVRLVRTFSAATGAPVEFPDLAQFVTAVTDPANPQRHAQVTFAALTDFLAAFTISGEPIELGDWDANLTPDSYEPGTLEFTAPLPLPDSQDRLQIVYQPDSIDPKFDQVAVVYLQAGHT